MKLQIPTIVWTAFFLAITLLSLLGRVVDTLGGGWRLDMLYWAFAVAIATHVYMVYRHFKRCDVHRKK